MILRSGITLSNLEIEEIQNLIDTVAEKTYAQLAVLVDVTGQVIAQKGKLDCNNTVALGALIAADLAANQEIAFLTGEKEPYRITIRVGQNSITYIADIKRLVAFFIQIPLLSLEGITQLHIQQSVYQLTTIFENIFLNNQNKPLPNNTPDNLEELFDQELEAMWME